MTKKAQVMSEADQLLTAVMDLPLPEVVLADSLSLAVVSKTYAHIARGLPRTAVEKLLLVGKDDITPATVQQASRLLEQQLVQYRREAFTVIARAEAIHQAAMGELGRRQGEVETQRGEFLEEIGTIIEEYQELLLQVALIKGYFKPEFETAAIAAAKEPGKRKKSRWAPITKVFGGLRQKVEDLYYLPESLDEGLDEEEEVQIIEAVEALAVYVDPALGLSREVVLEAVQDDIGWTIKEMVELVLEAESVFGERVREAKAIRDEQSQQYQVLLREIEGSIAATEGALASLDKKEEELTEAIQALEAQITAVQEIFPA